MLLKEENIERKKCYKKLFLKGEWIMKIYLQECKGKPSNLFYFLSLQNLP